MSMEISSSYGSYYTNTLSDIKKESKQSSEVKTDTRGKSKDNVQEYYEKLCKKFPQISFNTKGGVLPGRGSNTVVNLSYNCLKKMADDPEFAKEVEWNLSGEVAANSLIHSWAKRDGVEIGGRTITYDANGNRQSSCGGMKTANRGWKVNSITDKLQKKYQLEEERYLKTRKRREEREKYLAKY